MAALAMVPVLDPLPAHSQRSVQVPLECQLHQGLWQPCLLTIVEMGQLWWLEIGSQRIEFRSDGRGTITLRDPAGNSRLVQPVWTAQRALCWDGVCTKGDLPLD
jgi:hypothetical protein